MGSKLSPMIDPVAIFADLQMWLWFNIFSTSRDLIPNSVTCQSFWSIVEDLEDSA